MVGIALIGIAILIAYASNGSALPALASIGVAIFTSVTQNTIIGALNGDCSLTGALDGLADGLMLAGVSSVLIAGSFGISSKISYALAKKAVNPARAGPFVGPVRPSDVVLGQRVAVQPKNISTMADVLGDGGVGFGTKDQLKVYLRKQGIDLTGMEVHHIVEQFQIGKGGITAQQVHNTANVVLLPKSVHVDVTKIFNSKSGVFSRFRFSLVGESFAHQFQVGTDALARVGVFL